jgi:hypothetical protein
MGVLVTFLADPRTLPAALALLAALTALIKAEAARIDARNAIKRSGGSRQTPPDLAIPPPGQPERRKPP